MPLVFISKNQKDHWPNEDGQISLRDQQWTWEKQDIHSLMEGAFQMGDFSGKIAGVTEAEQ